MGAGAAVKGLIGGYQQGRKFAQDEERFEMEKEDFQQRKELRGLQMEGTKLSNKKAQGELDDADFDRDVRNQADAIRKDYEGKIRALQEPAPVEVAPQAAGITQPPVPGGPAPGIQDPAGAASRAAPRPSMFQLQQDMTVALLNNELRSKGANRGAILKDILAAGRFAKTAEAQATLDAINAWESGVPQEQIFSELRQKFGRDIPAGTEFVKTNVPLYEGSKTMVPDVQLKLPDGKIVSRSSLAKSMLSPEQIVQSNTEIGKLHSQVSHYADMKELAEQEGRRRETADANRHQEVMARFRESAEQNARIYGLQFDKFQWDKYDSRQKSALDEFSRLYGFQPLTESERVKIEKESGADALAKAEARATTGSQSVSAGMIVYNMNVDPRTLRPNVAPTEAIKAIETVGKVRRKELPPETIQQDDLGRSYVSVGGNRVLVPVNADLGPARGRAEAAAEADPKRPGVKPPPVDAPPLPARYSGLQERGAEETKRRSEAEAKMATEKKAKEEAKATRTNEAKGFTPDRIRVMRPSEAQSVLSEYGDVLSREQRAMLRKRI
jgi:hypothetical protein